MVVRAVTGGTGRVRGGRVGAQPAGPALLPGPVITGTTLDPANKATALNLDASNLTASTTANGNGFVRSVMGVSSGKRFASFTIGGTAVASGMSVGVVDTATAVSTNPASSAGAVGAWSDGNVYGGGSFATIGFNVSYAAGDTVQVALDRTAKLIWFRKNNTGNWNSSGTANPATGVGGFALPSGFTGTTYLQASPWAIGNLATLDPNPATIPSGFLGWSTLNTVAIDVIVVAGQSNASGFAADASVLAYQLDPNVISYDGSSNFATYAPLSFTGLEWGSAVGNWGAEMEYSRQYRTANPTKKLAIVKYAAAGSGLFQSADGQTTYDWNTASTAELYANAGTIITNGLAALTAAGYVPTVRLVWWMQGEFDATNTTFASAYQTNLTNLINGARTTWSLGASKPFVIGKIKNIATFASTVRTAQANVVTAAPGGPTLGVETDDLAVNVSDNIHYTADSLITIGQRIFAVA